MKMYFFPRIKVSTLLQKINYRQTKKGLNTLCYIYIADHLLSRFIFFYMFLGPIVNVLSIYHIYCILHAVNILAGYCILYHTCTYAVQVQNIVVVFDDTHGPRERGMGFHKFSDIKSNLNGSQIIYGQDEKTKFIHSQYIYILLRRIYCPLGT
jgi:hypothetical protein